jgi:exopolysaccharide biosynthesis polyprenyl glycosylphosphotransferase
MLRRFSTNFAVFSIAFDLLVVALSLWGVNQLRPILNTLPFAKPITAPPPIPIQMYLTFPLVWVLIMLAFSVYDGRKNIRIVDEFTNLTLGSLLAGITLAGVLYLTFRDTSRVTFLVFFLTTYLLLILWRVVIRLIHRRHSEQEGPTNIVLIVGAGPVGRDIEARIKNHSHLEVKLSGFLDDNLQKRDDHPDILGNLDDIRMIIQKDHTTDVVIALPTRAYEKVNSVVKKLDDLPVKVWIIPDYFSLSLHHTEMHDFLGIPMLDLRAAALTEFQRMIKRIFDLVITAGIMIFALPVMGIVALLIWLSDGKPIFFTQRRVGENGKLFEIYKFRTMIRDAEVLQKNVEIVSDQGELIHKKKDDPRITPLGRFLRRLSLDELPQFFNVMRGNMSLVGPRPELPYLVELYQPWQRKRFSVPQGMTGWWQIHGRSDKPMHLHTEDDLYYIQNYSLWLDVQILMQTIWIILRGKGAY